MKLSRISLLCLLLFLLVPSASYAQSVSDKIWQSYWTKFSAATKNKDLKALKVLSIQKPFSSGGGIEDTFDEFWQGNKETRNKTWKYLTKSVNSGTKIYSNKLDDLIRRYKSVRVTNDDIFVFVYTKNGWRWWGVMGD